MQRSSSITSKPISVIDTNKNKGKRIVISGVIASAGDRDSVGIDIRHFYRDKETGEYKPTTKGIFLSKNDLRVVLSEMGFSEADLDGGIRSFLGQKEKTSMLSL